MRLACVGGYVARLARWVIKANNAVLNSKCRRAAGHPELWPGPIRDMPSVSTDLHLSDVHLHCPGSTSAADEVSRFAFSTDSAESSATTADDDGDPIIKRRRAGRSGALKLRHALATPLPDVGLQVWRGALLLCDYLLARPSLVRGATILELGAGCGLCGLLSMVDTPVLAAARPTPGTYSRGPPTFGSELPSGPEGSVPRRSDGEERPLRGLHSGASPASPIPLLWYL